MDEWLKPVTDLWLHLRKSRPGLGRKTDYKHSPTSAIKLFCLGCQGGSSSAVKSCKSYDCPLWLYRSNPDTLVIPSGVVPTIDEYDLLTEGRGNAEALLAHRTASKA